jgi:hypothetical protein
MVIFMHCPSINLESRVNLPGSAAFGGIAGDVKKITFLMAAGAFFRGLSRGDGVLTIAAPPVGQIALGTNIPDKFP